MNCFKTSPKSNLNYSLKKLTFMFSAVFALMTTNTCGASGGFPGTPKTEVLVLGTIHQLHSSDTNYTFNDIIDILETYNPDVVCVEIREAEFRKEAYLPEMTMATIWGINHNKKVYPIDWWLNDTRRLRDSLMKLPDYKQKEQQVEAAGEKDSIITVFESKYGTWKEQSQMGYSFWNGKEYNEYTKENYRLWMDVFGDDPITLYYKSRNDSMMTRIQYAVGVNPGSKVIVLTGSEHKHYFDNVLEQNPDVSVIEFQSILPIEKNKPDSVITAYLDEGNDLLYYETGYPRNINDYYRAKLIPLIHGGGMDEYPENVPSNNIIKAEKIIERWRSDTTSNAVPDNIAFELGLISFIKADYQVAIEFLLPLSQRIEAGTVHDPLITAITHRNLGLCYDCIGERDSAKVCYIKGEELLGKTQFMQAKEMLFKNYTTQPYIRKNH